jgi:hypothetical protein
MHFSEFIYFYAMLDTSRLEGPARLCFTDQWKKRTVLPTDITSYSWFFGSRSTNCRLPWTYTNKKWFLTTKTLSEKQLIPCCNVFTEKVIVTRLVRNYLAIMKLGVPLPRSQMLATIPHPGPEDSSSHLHTRHH